MIESSALQNYLDHHAHNLDSHLDVVERNTHLRVLQSHMISGRHQGVFLKMMALGVKASTVVEIGTFTGYTALAFAEAVGDNGRVITIECDEEIAAIAQSNFQSSSYGSKIELVVGQAGTLLEDIILKDKPQLVFIDADKENNLLYYNICIDSLVPGSIILVDNVLWKGKVLDEAAYDKKTMAIKKFNDFVGKDERVDACILPIRDGIYFIRKR